MGERANKEDKGGKEMDGIQIAGSGTYISNEYIKLCVDGIFQALKENLPEHMQTTEIITVILNLVKEELPCKPIIL